jgi:hypothetical protein
MRTLLLLQRLGLGSLFAALGAAVPAHAAKVEVTQDASGHWRLLRNGAPYQINGVGGFNHLELAAACGATTLRTWGADSLDHLVGEKNLLDRAHALNLTVVAGLWVQHPSLKHDYTDPVFLEQQRTQVREAVRKHRHHPALLVWGLGNEMENGANPADPLLWREMEYLARIIKTEDPDHPVMTVVAGGGPEKIGAIKAHYPSLDILGINAYGPAVHVNRMLDETGWDRPYMLTEFGPRGQWEVLHTPWNAPIEPGSGEKEISYVSAHRSALADLRQRCLGTFCFTWGQKQEATATWFGMFLATGEKTPLVDAMAYEFTRRWPANRSPQIYSLKTALALDRVPPGKKFTAQVDASDPEQDALTYEWLVVAESTDRKTGGAPEAAPPVIAGCIQGPPGPVVTVRTPDQPGAYRLYLYVRDGQGGGCAENVPFYVLPR